MRARFILLATLGFVAAILGCGDDKTTVGPGAEEPPPEVCAECLDSGPGSDLVPLQAGNYWIYEYHQYDASGEVAFDSAFEVVVDSVVERFGAEWYDISYHGSDGKPDASYGARNCPTGYCVLTYDVFMQYNSTAVAGEGYWNLIPSGSDRGKQHFTYLGELVGVEVPAGTFDCRFYSGEIARAQYGWPYCRYAAPGCADCPWFAVYRCSDYRSRHWVSAGVGIVKMETFGGGPEQPIIQRWVLKETNVTAGR